MNQRLLGFCPSPSSRSLNSRRVSFLSLRSCLSISSLILRASLASGLRQQAPTELSVIINNIINNKVLDKPPHINKAETSAVLLMPAFAWGSAAEKLQQWGNERNFSAVTPSNPGGGALWGVGVWSEAWSQGEEEDSDGKPYGLYYIMGTGFRC